MLGLCLGARWAEVCSKELRDRRAARASAPGLGGNRSGRNGQGTRLGVHWGSRTSQPATLGGDWLGSRFDGGGRRLLQPCCLPGFVSSLKPARFENKHVQLPRRTILAAGPEAFTGQSLRALPSAARVGGGASCIFINTWIRGPWAAHAHCPPRRSPSPRQWLGKRPAERQGGARGPSNADRRAICGGAVGKPRCYPHTPPPKACVYIFSRNSPGQKSPLTHRLSYPYPFSWFYLPPQLSVFFASG